MQEYFSEDDPEQTLGAASHETDALDMEDKLQKAQ